MRRKALLIAVLVAGTWMVPLPAMADSGGDGQVVVDSGLNQVQVFSLLLGVVLPIIVALVTKRVTSEATKAILLAALAAITGVLTEYAHSIGSGSFDWWTAVLTALGTFIVAVATHFGFWKPTGVAARVQATGPIK